jgi:hypothetical protein
MTKPTPDRPHYVLTLQPLPEAEDPRGIRRIRAALKALLRSYRLRCVGFDRLPHDSPGESDVHKSAEQP